MVAKDTKAYFWAMMVITGAGGFIGGRLARRLQELGFKDLVLVDDFTNADKRARVQNLTHRALVQREMLPSWLTKHHESVQVVFHMGARTDTLLADQAVFQALNLNYSQDLWRVCARYGLPLIYASSAATYGLGEQGFRDGTEVLPLLKPLNPYALSKHQFDCWTAEQEERPLQAVGLKFFNVYGSGESHKGRMASVVWHAYGQIRESGRVRLFRSHHPDVADGAQQRDFVTVEDVVEICLWFMNHGSCQGLYNVGTGRARSFRDLVLALFEALGLEPQIEFVDTPLHLRAQYQYYTCADMGWMDRLACSHTFRDLKEGVQAYVRQEWGIV
jgi:ADP-L-glycero-D-manno-heptose 6-epimerase